MRRLSMIPLLLVVLCVPSQTAEAAFYKYVDESGQMHFVDDVTKIPARYREEKQVIQEEKDLMTVEEYQELKRERHRKFEALKERRRLQLESLAEKPEQLVETPVIISRNQVLVPVVVSHGGATAELMLLLDTGASATVLHRDALAGIALPAGRKVIARIAGGKRITSRKIKFNTIEIGPYRERNMIAMVLTPVVSGIPYDGMLGMDFLRSHPHRIDYENETIIWESE